MEYSSNTATERPMVTNKSENVEIQNIHREHNEKKNSILKS